MDTIQLTNEQVAELTRLKQYFPYRVVWGAVHPDTKEWIASANTTKRQLNTYLKNGWIVYKA